MMSLDEAIAKATKLLNLSKSSNANEAALAAQRAQEILARYSIDMASIDASGEAPQKEEEIGKGHKIDSQRKSATWKAILAQHIAMVNACRVYSTHDSEIYSHDATATMLVGRASDVAKVRYLYVYLTGEVDRLAKTLAMGHGRSYANSFRMGAVKAIGESLRAAQKRVAQEMRDEQLHNPAALVRIDKGLAKLAQRDSAVDAWIDAHMNMRSSRRSYSGNGTGYGAGYAAGQSVNVGGGVARGALGTGQSRLR